MIGNSAYKIKSGPTILFHTGTEYMWKIGDMRYIAINFGYTAAHKHIKARPIRSRDIADDFHFNPTYIGRVFKSHTGFTLRTFIVDYRINRAKEILRTQETSVGETAAAVGFTEVPHFIKTFRAHVGKIRLNIKRDKRNKKPPASRVAFYWWK